MFVISCGVAGRSSETVRCRPRCCGHSSEGYHMRIAVGGYLLAINTFATPPVGLEQVQRATLTGDAILRASRGESAIAGFFDGARQRNWDVAPLPFVLGPIGGSLTRHAHECAKEALLSALRKSSRVDGVFLQLHGTAVADH